MGISDFLKMLSGRFGRREMIKDTLILTGAVAGVVTLDGCGPNGNEGPFTNNVSPAPGPSTPVPTPVPPSLMTNPDHNLVLENAKVLPVFIGEDWKTSYLPDFQKNIMGFLQDLSTSQFITDLGIYGVQSCTILPAVNISLEGIPRTWTSDISNASIPNSDYDRRLAQAIEEGYRNGTLPQDTPLILSLPPGIPAPAIYHANIPALKLPYSLIPYLGDTKGDSIPNDRFFNMATGMDIVCLYYAHELREMLTNPLRNAVFNRRNGKEVVDQCDDQALVKFKTSNGYTVHLDRSYINGKGCEPNVGAVVSPNSAEISTSAISPELAAALLVALPSAKGINDFLKRRGEGLERREQERASGKASTPIGRDPHKLQR